MKDAWRVRRDERSIGRARRAGRLLSRRRRVVRDARGTRHTAVRPDRAVASGAARGRSTRLRPRGPLGPRHRTDRCHAQGGSGRKHGAGAGWTVGAHDHSGAFAAKRCCCAVRPDDDHGMSRSPHDLLGNAAEDQSADPRPSVCRHADHGVGVAAGFENPLGGSSVEDQGLRRCRVGEAFDRAGDVGTGIVVMWLGDSNRGDRGAAPFSNTERDPQGGVGHEGAVEWNDDVASHCCFPESGRPFSQPCGCCR